MIEPRFRPAADPLLKAIRDAYTGRAMKSAIRSFGFEPPEEVTSMYLHGEPAEFIQAAVIAVNQKGE